MAKRRKIIPIIFSIFFIICALVVIKLFCSAARNSVACLLSFITKLGKRAAIILFLPALVMFLYLITYVTH